MAYPTPAPARPVHVIRVPVAVLVPLAVVAVAGLLIWGGGETAEYAGAGVSGGDGFGVGGSSSGAAGDAPAAAGGPGATTTLPPLDPSLAGTFVGEPIAPTEFGASHAWRLGGEWTGQLSVYQEVFPIAGYRLGEQRITDSGGGGAWDIVPDQPGPQVGIGLLYVGPDPADPASTIIEIEVY